MSGAPRLSVVMPVYNGERLLPLSLVALESSDLARSDWELVVVDDGSTDECAQVAAPHADRVVRVADGPTGPARARNRGVEVARGDLVAFVDADVLVHADTLRIMLDVLEGDPTLGAVFGSYDERPRADGFLSQYRNLLHRYHHLLGAGEADTFWAGCGAVRRSAFLDVGGFDAQRFPRPQIEDIELGYRLRDAGWRIQLEPAIQGTHLKRWTLGGILRTDVMDRGIPWMRLLLQRSSGRSTATLNIRWEEKVKTGLVGAALVLTVGAVLFGEALSAALAVLPLAVVLLANLNLYRWFAGRRGWGFALRVVPFNLLYYVINGTCVLLAWTIHARERLGAGSRSVPSRSRGAHGVLSDDRR